MARIAGINLPVNKRALIALQYIHGIGQYNAKNIIELFGSKYIKNLEIYNFKNLAIFSFPQLTALENLTFRGDFKFISRNIKLLKNLTSLCFNECTYLESIPSQIGELDNLRTLIIDDCEGLISIPSAIKNLKKLKVLCIKKCANIKMLSSEIWNLTNIEELSLELPQSQSIPPEIGNLKKLKSLSLSSLFEVSSFPLEMWNLENLESLTFEFPELYSIDPKIGNLQNLQNLSITESKITALPLEIGHLRKLKNLNLLRNLYLKHIPLEIGNLKLLEKIDFTNFLNLYPLARLNIIFGLRIEKAKKICPTIFVHDQRDFIDNLVKDLIFLKINLQDLNKNNFYESLTFENLKNFAMLAIAYQEEKENIVFLIKNSSLNADTLSRLSSQLLLGSPQNFNEVACHINFCVDFHIDNLNLNNFFRSYFKFENNYYWNSNLINIKKMADFLLTSEGKEILIEYRDIIFRYHHSFRGFVYKNYPSNQSENIQLYPIEMEYKNDLQLREVVVLCFKSDLKDEKKLIEFLHALAEINPKDPWKFFTKYRNQKGIDQGAISIDFIVNLFKTLSKKWKLYKEIPLNYISDLEHLGRILGIVYRNSKCVLGPVLNPYFYKTIIRFDYRQLISNIEDLNEKEMLTIAEGYLSNDKLNSLKKSLDFFLSNDQENLESQIQTICGLHEIHSFDSLPLEICDEGGNIDFINLQKWLDENENGLNLLKSTIKKELFSNIRIQLKMIQSLFKYMYVTKERWNQITISGFEKFKVTFEGMFDRKFLIKSLRFKNIHPKTQAIFRIWLNKITDEQLKRFTILATSSPYVSLGTKITIEGLPDFFNEKNELDISKNSIFFHGCISTITLPKRLMDRRSIEFELNEILKCNTNFNVP